MANRVEPILAGRAPSHRLPEALVLTPQALDLGLQALGVPSATVHLRRSGISGQDTGELSPGTSDPT